MPNCPYCQQYINVTLSQAGGAQQRESGPAKSSGSIGALLDSIEDDALEGAAAKFVGETRSRYEQYGERTRLSEKQLAWLQRIAGGETGSRDQW